MNRATNRRDSLPVYVTACMALSIAAGTGLLGAITIVHFLWTVAAYIVVHFSDILRSGHILDGPSTVVMVVCAAFSLLVFVWVLKNRHHIESALPDKPASQATKWHIERQREPNKFNHVPCRFCGARSGESCTNTMNGRPSPVPHMCRIACAKEYDAMMSN